jgi:long-chain acyl-CoA synthetase
VFEKVHEKATCAAREAGGARRRLFDWALGVGQRVSRLRQRSEPVPLGLRLAHRLADAFALRKVRGVFGGRLIYAISGAAPLNPAIAEFFHASGVLILEGIGMTENTSFSNVNRFHANKFGTVGPVGPGIEMKLAPDGEILFRGPNVMNGYFKDEAATAEAIDAEGWLHTGDVGTIDEDGFLTITDRKKDLIVTSGGKNVAPQKIERALRASPYIAQAVAVGDRRKFIAALVTLDPDRIGLWARERGIAHGDAEELARHPAVHELIGAEIERCNRELAPFESVKRFRILARDLSIEAGELTPTLKIRRRAVAERYAALIEEMYRG